MRINRHGNAYKQNRLGMMSKWNMTIGALLLISVTSSTAVPGLQEQERGIVSVDVVLMCIRCDRLRRELY